MNENNLWILVSMGLIPYAIRWLNNKRDSKALKTNDLKGPVKITIQISNPEAFVRILFLVLVMLSCIGNFQMTETVVDEPSAGFCSPNWQDFPLDPAGNSATLMEDAIPEYGPGRPVILSGTANPSPDWRREYDD